LPYVGKTPVIGNFLILDSISTSATDTFALTSASVAYAPQSANHCIVSLNGVIQAPISSFTISGTNIIFASALTTDDTIDFIQVLGDTLSIGTPSDGTVGIAKLSATGTKDGTTFLRGDNTFAAAGGGGVTNAQSFQITSDTAISGSGYLSANWGTNSGGGVSTYSNKGTLVSQSSGTFSMSATGYYFVIWNLSANFTVSGSQDSATWDILGTSNNSTYESIGQSFESYDYAEHRTNATSIQVLFNCNDVSNDKLRFGYGSGNGHDGVTVYGNSTTPRTWVSFIRLGDSV